MWCKYFGTIPIIAFLFLSLTHFPQAQSWTQLFPTGSTPSTRAGHTAVYDPANNRMTVFGGENEQRNLMNDLWMLSTANGLGGTPAWIQLSPTPDSTQSNNGYGGLPAMRSSHTAIYDSANNRMTIFGGALPGWTEFLNDVWVLSNANGLRGMPTWIQLTTIGSIPTTRYGHTAIYDSANNRMTIFGGHGSSSLLNDVWVLSNANGLGGISAWTQLTATGVAPYRRYGHTAVYDATNNRMIIFGGAGDTNYDNLNDVWVLSNANGLGGTPAWIQLSPTGSTPTTRQFHSAIYDSMRNRMTIFGGAGPNYYYNYNDVWVMSNANGLGGTPAWTQIVPTGSTPTTRYVHTAIYDSVSNRMTLFGGVSSLTFLNDLWVLTNSDYLTSVPKSIWELLDK